MMMTLFRCSVSPSTTWRGTAGSIMASRSFFRSHRSSFNTAPVVWYWDPPGRRSAVTEQGGWRRRKGAGKKGQEKGQHPRRRAVVVLLLAYIH